jgi:hypothetical protein
MPDIDDKIRFVIPIMLDRVSVELGPWSGYHVLAQHRGLSLRGISAECEPLSWGVKRQADTITVSHNCLGGVEFLSVGGH